ncbi:MAG: S8 family serine peptidase [Candidatus Spyradenecus sp.]
MRFVRMMLVLCGGVLAALLGAQVRFAEKNIDWGAVAESEVERVTVATATDPRLKMAMPGTEVVLEKRTLTLPSGNKLRITERIEADEQGEEARIFVEGKQLGEVTVVASEETLEAVLEFLRARGYGIVARYGRLGRILKVRIPPNEQREACELLGKLAELGVESAAHEQVRFFLPQVITPAATPNDPRYGEQWGLQQIHAPEVWAQGFLGYPSIPCAVYDTGVHLEHEDLQENVRERVSVLNSSADPEDHHGHGSHCLGIMGADSNNGKGITGVGQVANLTSLRGPISYWQEGDDIRAGYQYALENGIKVLSCSFGTSPGVGVFDAGDYALITDLGAAGTLLVIAAGNDGNDNDRLPTYPSSYDCENILTVIASDKADRPVIAGNNEEGEGAHVWSTSYGATSCDIAAPGANILSCTRDGPATYEKWSGTSMATPMVAACAAMLWERNPSWSPLDIKRRLMATADVKDTLLGYCQSGGRVNLQRALDQSAGYISLAPMESTAIEAGTPITLTVTAENVPALTFKLLKRGALETDIATLTPTQVEGSRYTVWTPTEADVGRGYTIRVESTANPTEVFAYSSLFRVKSAEKEETITVSTGTEGAVLAADSFTVSFTPSDAVMIDLTLEEQLADGTWELAATLGQLTCTPGARASANLQLKGRGWLTGTYRVRVYDTDAPEISGASLPFTFGTSLCSVYLLPGSEVSGAPADYKERREDYLAAWQSTYAAGEPFRLNCYFPESSLYWLYLIDATAEEIFLLKQVWTDVSTGNMKRMQSFELAIPDHFTPGHTYWLRLYDAFAPEMYHDSPRFTLAPRTDGRTAPSLDALLGVPEGTGFNANGQWHPVWQDDAWALRCGWLSPGEEAYFEAVLTTTKEQSLAFDLHFPKQLSGAQLTVAYAEQFPTNTSTWTELATTHGGYADDWVTLETQNLPPGTHTLRWTLKRDPKASPEKDEAAAFSLLLRNLTFSLAAPTPTLSFNASGTATLGNRPDYPGFVTYTIDGSEPTRDGPRWVSGQSLTFSASTTLKVKSFLPAARPSATATAVYLNLAGAGTAASPHLITSGADLLALLSAVNLGTLTHDDGFASFSPTHDFSGKVFRLTRNLDLTGLTLPTAGFPAITTGNNDAAPFNGTLDGAGYFLRHATFAPTHSPFYDDGVGQVCGLFGNLGPNGTVQNLTLLDPTYAVPGGDLFALGAIAATLDGTIDTCQVLRATFSAPSFIPGTGHFFSSPLYGLGSDYPAIGGAGWGRCTLNGAPLPDSAADEKLLSQTFLPPPTLSPAPGPIFEETLLALSAPEGARVQRWDGKDWADAPAALTLAATQTLTLRTTDGTNTSAEVVATYDRQNKPACPAVSLDSTDGTPLGNNTNLTPFTTYAKLSTATSNASAGGWRIHYTLDGTEPTEASPRYAEPFLLPGECTLKARIFNPPDYAPGPLATYAFSISPQFPNCARLTLVGGTLQGKTLFTGSDIDFDRLSIADQKAILYQSQAFTVQANEAPAGHFFSHWRVTGPLVLDNPRANPLTTRYMTREPVTLEAIFLPLRPGYHLRLQ